MIFLKLESIFIYVKCANEINMIIGLFLFFCVVYFRFKVVVSIARDKLKLQLIATRDRDKASRKSYTYQYHRWDNHVLPHIPFVVS